MKGTRDLVDRISALPDSILSLILSSLPTKNAVATSILSKRWKFSWTTVLNLDFSHENYSNGENEDEEMKFVQFVNRVLLLHDGGLLHKFRLVWKRFCIPSQVDSWIRTAITRNVSQLVLSLRGSEPFQIPTSVFSCNTLQSLELKGIMWVPAADAIVVCLPRLECLKFVSVFFKSQDSLQNIIRGCPMLNDLHLHMIADINAKYFREEEDDRRSELRFIISSTSLRRLELGVVCWGEPIPSRLELEASSLEYLKLKGFISHIFVQGSLSSLVEADFRMPCFDDGEYTQDTYNSVVEVVRAFHCAKSITLSTHVMWALSHATICMSTKFSRLKKLKAGADCFYCSSLEDFIQSSDNLEVLTIYQDSMDRYISVSDDHDKWTAPVEVPRCLSNSLRAVVFDGYSGSEDERGMIGYLLKHGSALEVMQISCYRDDMRGVKFELVQETCKLAKLPRKSTACKIVFSTSRFCEPMAGEMMINLSD